MDRIEHTERKHKKTTFQQRIELNSFITKNTTSCLGRGRHSAKYHEQRVVMIGIVTKTGACNQSLQKAKLEDKRLSLCL